jgi:hypothetical protein
MQPITKRAMELRDTIAQAYAQLNIAAKAEELAHIDRAAGRE